MHPSVTVPERRPHIIITTIRPAGAARVRVHNTFLVRGINIFPEKGLGGQGHTLGNVFTATVIIAAERLLFVSYIYYKYGFVFCFNEFTRIVAGPIVGIE